MPTTLYKVITPVASMYKSQSILSSILAILVKNTYVDVNGISNGWANCVYNTKTGFIQASRLQMVTGSVTIKYVNESNVSISADKVDKNLPLGTYTYSAIAITGYTLTSTSPVTVTLRKGNQNPTITFKYKKNIITTGSVTVKYMNEDTNTKIIPDELFTNLALGTYTYTAKTFEGLGLSGSSTQTVTLTDDSKNKVVVFNYKIMGSVNVAYVDKTNDLKIIPNDVYSNLILGTYTYDAKTFQGYTLIGDGSQSVELTTDSKDKILIFYYSKDEVKGSVAIAYIDFDNNEKVIPNDIYGDLKLGTYTYDAKIFEGYFSLGDKKIQVELTDTEKDKFIIFYYRACGSVSIAYLDQDRNTNLAPNDIFTQLNLGTYTYTAKDFEKYSLIGDKTQTVTLTKAENNKSIAFYYKDVVTVGSVLITYVDQSTNQKIGPDDIHADLLLGKYYYDAKAFDGYTLITPTPQNVTLTSTNPNQIIVFYYKLTGTITVSYIDVDNNVRLATSEVHQKLDLGKYTYTAKTFDGYDLISEASITVELTSTELNKTVIFNYRPKGAEPVDETEIPYISIYYYDPKPTDDKDVIIPLYFTDFYQKEYYDDDHSLRFKLRYEIDGTVEYIEDLPAGDYDLNLGKLTEGMHWYSAQVEDIYGRVSRRIFNDLWVINEANYAIKPNEIYTVTDEDLAAYKINKNNSEVETDMVNNRVGLSQMFADLRGKSFRKIILPLGTYRVNRCLRQGTIAAQTCPIIIPSGLTIDMNRATFKLHPYNDRTYGTKAQVENLIVRMSSCKDSHLTNGTVEGDFFERQNLIWTDGSNAISGSNGEQSNGIYMYGCEFSSLDNMTIKQVTGYNVCAGQDGSYGWGTIGPWTDNLAIINGVEVSKTGYTTCSSCTMDANMLANKYVVASVWLGYGGIKGNYWDMDFHFYDTNNNFIETIKVYQFTRCRIPEGAKTLRMTFRTTATNVSGLSLHHMKVTRYSSLNNCQWIDNRTCSAPFQFQHFAYNNCTFTRSGQSITPCEIDVEDGWEQSQDLFVRGCEVLENVGTADIIDNAGINHVMENCKNMSIVYRYRLTGITIRNNTNIGLSSTIGWMTGNTIRIYANNTIQSFNFGVTENTFWNYEKIRCKIINNTCTVGSVNGTNIHFYSIDNSNIIFTGLSKSIKILNSIISYKGYNCYVYGDIYIDNCNFILAPSDTKIQFSFNEMNGKRQYTNCVYNASTEFLNHNQFNSGTWTGCTFKDTLLISTNQTNNMGDISFNNCTFNKDVTIDLGVNAKVQFNKCNFIGKIIFKNSGEANSQFNN